MNCTHLHCASEHPWCKCACILNLCSLITPVRQAHLSVLFTAFPVPCIPACMQLFAQSLCWGRTSHIPCPVSPWEQETPSPPTQVGIETVCGNTSLSPWWRNLCLSTVFYSVCSDDRWSIKPVRCAGPGWVSCVSPVEPTQRYPLKPNFPFFGLIYITGHPLLPPCPSYCLKSPLDQALGRLR